MSSSLPPGCRFYPSDQHLLCYYLTSKNHTNIDADDGNRNVSGYDLIKELDLYSHEPFDLPENACYAYGCGGFLCPLPSIFQVRGGNSISENMLSSCAEESVSAVRHVGIQHDGFLTPDIVEAKVHQSSTVDRKNDLSRLL
ncbi:hypothetical protein GH714_012759 [Hevea brasiliensis]|uniref:NAC domain-containing protein n=1 Tax=Hevea brasiliensis TaxID=3981 RepID=A0A6A6NGT1_HEVBR|nr:hypothetical protein GH714_012759 [Hevea brasiliensis]